jgi:hypothetical protein
MKLKEIITHDEINEGKSFGKKVLAGIISALVNIYSSGREPLTNPEILTLERLTEELKDFVAKYKRSQIGTGSKDDPLLHKNLEKKLRYDPKTKKALDKAFGMEEKEKKEEKK